jgi:hypothetical protein
MLGCTRSRRTMSRMFSTLSGLSLKTRFSSRNVIPRRSPSAKVEGFPGL